MRKLLFISLSICMLAGGCQLGPRKTEEAVPVLISKSFFDRTIVYKVSPGAKDYMRKLEGLLARGREADEPLRDEDIITLYRDADLNRDHSITELEAKTFYDDYVIRFEDMLGPVQLR